jgi:uncharacterized protein related to proFAR isomerase
VLIYANCIDTGDNCLESVSKGLNSYVNSFDATESFAQLLLQKQIVVSLKEGLFSGANVLFQAKFRDGTSIVEVSLLLLTRGTSKRTVLTSTPLEQRTAARSAQAIQNGKENDKPERRGRAAITA